MPVNPAFLQLGAPILGPTGVGSANQYLKTDGAGATSWDTPSGGGGGTVLHATNGFRLTTESGVPVSTSDRTSQSTIYLTPFISNQIAIYDGSAWQIRSTAEVSLALSGLTSGKNYDVFAYYTGSAVALELSAAWTNDTTRADAIVRQDGVWCKSGTLTRRLVGTIRATGTTTTEDSLAKRLVWNANNLVRRPLAKTDATSSWTYGTAAWRAMNNSSSNRVEVVVGLLGPTVEIWANVTATIGSGTDSAVGIGEDATTTNNSLAYGSYSFSAPSSNVSGAFWAALLKHPAIGYHYYAPLEWGPSSGSTTFYGERSSGGGPIRPGVNGYIEG